MDNFKNKYSYYKYHMDTNQVCVFKMPRMSGKSTFVKLYILNKCASENDLNVIFISQANSDIFFTRDVINNFNIHDSIDWNKTKINKKDTTIYFKDTNSIITIKSRIEKYYFNYDNCDIIILDDCEYILSNSTNVNNLLMYVRDLYDRKTKMICTFSHNILNDINVIFKNQSIEYHYDDKSDSDLNDFNKYLRILKIKSFCDE